MIATRPKRKQQRTATSNNAPVQQLVPESAPVQHHVPETRSRSKERSRSRNRNSRISKKSAVSTQNMTADEQMNVEVRLYDSSQERKDVRQLANIYSLINTLSIVERAYLSDNLPESVYEAESKALLSKISQTKKLGEVDLNEFTREWKMNVPAALHRIAVGVPATIEFGGSSNTMSVAKDAADTTQSYITALDALELEQMDVDQIQPLIRDICVGLNKFPQISQEDTTKKSMVEWLTSLNSRQPGDSLSDNELRQLKFDIDNSYANFHSALK
ncbi:hypothetical protein PCE1_004393 [Barthelona sp. PCE]